MLWKSIYFSLRDALSRLGVQTRKEKAIGALREAIRSCDNERLDEADYELRQLCKSESEYDEIVRYIFDVEFNSRR